MSGDFLSRLYWDCSDAGGEEDSSLCGLYERTEDTQKADRCFSEHLYATSLTKEEKSPLENISCSIAWAREKQGFLNGFRLGMKLAGELRGEEPG